MPNKKRNGRLTPKDERLLSLLEAVDRVLSAEHVTTVETIMVARQLMLSATLQIAHDRSTSGRLLPTGRKNPQSDPLAIIDQVSDSMRQSARAALRRPTLAEA